MVRPDALPPRTDPAPVPRRIVRAFALLLLAAFLLAAAGCSASYLNPGTGNGDGDTADKGGTGSQTSLVGPTSALERKVIATATAGLSSDDVMDSADRLAAAVAALGGYVAGDSRTEVSQGRFRATMVLKVPAEAMAGLMARLSEFGKVVSTATSTEDVTDQYYDVQARLTNALAQEAQLLEIMKTATTVSDTLLVRSELDKVQQTIEQLKGQIRLWDALVDLGTLNVTIEPTAQLVGDGSGFRVVTGSELWKGISKGFLGSVAFVANAGAYLLMGLAYLSVPIAAIAILVVLVVVLVRARRRARARRNAPPPTPPAA